MATVFFGIYFAILGLAIGSFINVVAMRLPAHERLSGRSRCPKCRARIPWYHNVPVLSYLWLSGRCARCRKPISWQYPAVELTVAALYLLVAVKYAQVGGQPVDLSACTRSLLFAIRDGVFLAVLVVVFLIDLRHYLILDIITLPAAALALAANLWLGQSFWELAIGGILGAGFFGAQYVISSGRWIGDGDIRLGLLLGLMLGWPKLLVCLVFAYTLGAIVSLGLIVSGRRKFGSAVPFGTFLSAGGAFSLLYGDAVIRWYLRLLGF
ncbi:MAG: prepilin peptidase [Patescibacteria group bacterium]|nr:prepilin peptidase [Patescibacteria group bacterium]